MPQENERGLTLVEVLGTLVILGIAMLVITSLLQQTAVHTKDNQEIELASVIARDTLEQIKLHTQDNISACQFSDNGYILEKVADTSFTPAIQLSPIACSTGDDYQIVNTEDGYVLEIASEPAQLGSVTLLEQEDSHIVNLDDHFRLVKVTISGIKPDGSHTDGSNQITTYTAYVEIN